MRAWARLIAKIYEIDLLVFPRCESEMKIIAVIEDSEEVGHIILHLISIGRSPPGLDIFRLN